MSTQLGVNTPSNMIGDGPVIKIATDFSPTPGGRLIKTGPDSGEDFRQRILAPALRHAIELGQRVIVLLDDAITYPVSFLEEAFGGLVRIEGFTKPQLKAYLEIRADDPFYTRYRDLALSYIEKANPVLQ